MSTTRLESENNTSTEQNDRDGMVARDRRDELLRRRESLKQVNRGGYEAYATEENCGGELLVGVQWLAIVTREKPSSSIAMSCSRRRENPRRKNINSLIIFLT
ncbi:hypothetical protein Bca101_020823 [Brassica carinata]